jgi:hypothetical protein
MTNTGPSAPYPYVSQSLRWREDIKFLTRVVSKAALRSISIGGVRRGLLSPLVNAQTSRAQRNCS